MRNQLVRLTRLIGLFVAAVLAYSSVQLPMLALADTAPPDPADPKTPVSVSADPLPTVQINGVAWTQRVIGNTVYVGGRFTTARPAGSAAGVNTVARSNLLAYDIRTGLLVNTWAPTTNGDVLTIVPSPDGSRVYIGGSFTNVNGQIRNRIAAINTTTGALISNFQPKPDATVRAIAATSDTVYFGGLLSSVNSTARSKSAAVKASDGTLLPWAPTAAGGSVHTMILSPDNSRVIIGGSFTTMNGSGNPGYGLASIDPVTGANQAFNANGLIRDAGANAAITGLSTDGDSLYVSGFVFGSGGNLEGIARVDWATTNIVWVEDCHGDTYSSFPKGDLIYASSHAHYCGNLPDGFPQTDPWTQHYGTAFTKAVTGTLTADPLGYYNFAGNPSPSLQKWLPLMLNGTFTGQGQASWSVVGNNDYVAYGGEFPTAGGVPQQGLVRYAVKAIAPNKIGPIDTGSRMNPTVSSFARSTVKIAWKANWDRDNEQLTYSIIRNGDIANPIYTTTQLSSEWKRPGMGYFDKNLVPGQTYRYRVFAKDPLGNEARSDTVTVVVATDGAISTYAQDVMDDQAASYWRLGEPSGNAVVDWIGFNDAAAGTGVTRGTAGAIIGDSNNASTFDGTGNGLAVSNNAETGANTFTAESWIKTTTTSGGKILGFGGSNTGTSGNYDRHVYMANNGQLVFGVYPGGVRTVASSKSYNDGAWHHVVASLGSNGMVLYVDGMKVGGRTDTTSGQQYTGYWRIGGDNIGGWPQQPSSNYFSGAIDDVAIYPTALSAAQVRQHFLDSGRTLPGATTPADDYGKAVYNSEPDFFWRLADTTGSAAADVSPNQIPGTYDGGVDKGGVSGVGVAADNSVAFNGSNGAVASDVTFNNPTVYSEELWFKTNTAQGGKLIGFGNAKFGGSGGYDRHVYMFNDGRLRFGVWTGFTNVIDSTKAYNDNTWHHMVATQGGDGMKLFVDNELVGTNGQTSAQDYTGFWRVGGDTTWGGNSSNYFAGSIDEVAVYSKVLTPAEVTDHYGKGGGHLANVNPTADFSSAVTKLKVDFDGSTSTDSDGTVASYAWDFGDGGTSTLEKPSHTYGTAGDKTVALTVTDNDGGTNTVTKTVTAVANANPTAAFTFSVNKLAVSFDGSDSTDSDGTVASYAWDFGDGATSTLQKPNHSFGTVGDKTVLLTVTDNDGGTNTITKTVTTVANANPTAAFTSTVNKLAVSFDGSDSSDSDGTLASYAWDFGDGATSTLQKPNHTFGTAGDRTVVLTVTDNDGATDAITKTVTTSSNAKPTAAFTSTVNKLAVSFDGSDSSDSDGTVASYAWDFGDGATSTLQKPNHSYGTAGDKTVVLTVTDNDGATDSVTMTVTTSSNAKPTAAFISTVNDLTVSFDGSGSTDSDGTVASYAWDFGDGATSTLPKPNRTYGSAGDKTVVLTVTDNDGGTDTITKTVKPTAPAGPLAEDAFARTVSNGWGTANTGGAWTRYGTASAFSVASGVGQMTVTAASTGPRAALESVSSTSTDVLVKVSMDNIANGGGSFVSAGARTIGTNDYRAKVKVASNGALTIYLVKVVANAETTLTSVNLGSAFNYTTGATLQIRVQATGTSPTTVRAKAWKTSQTEPASWQVTTTDSSAGLQAAGGVGVATFLSSTSTNVPVVFSFDDLIVTTAN